MKVNALTIVLAYKPEPKMLKRCIDSVLLQDMDTEILVITSYNEKIVKKALASYYQLRRIHVVQFKHDYGAYAMKLCVAKRIIENTTFDAALFLDDDAYLGKKAATILYKHLYNNRKIGATQPLILNVDGSFQSEMLWINMFGSIKTRELGTPSLAIFPSGCCFMIKREVLELLNPNPLIDTWYDDVDLGIQMLYKGYFTLVVPYAKAYHGTIGRQLRQPSPGYQWKRASKHVMNYLSLIASRFSLSQGLVLLAAYSVGIPFTISWYLRKRQPYSALATIWSISKALTKYIEAIFYDYKSVDKAASSQVFNWIVDLTRKSLRK